MIEIRDLWKSFGEQPVLRGVNLVIDRGKTTVILGQSGCGKSVLIKHLLGLLAPDRGEILLDGVDITRLEGEDRARVLRRFGMLFQGGALFDSMTVEENIAFPLVEHTRKSPPEIRARVREVLGLVGLEGTEAKMPAELSGGMRKRAGLARAMVLDPEIIVFDEPTTGLDPIMSDAIDNLLLATQARLKITFVVISHDIVGTMKVANQVALLHEGRIIEAAPPERFQRSRNPFVRQFLERRAVPPEEGGGEGRGPK